MKRFSLAHLLLTLAAAVALWAIVAGACLLVGPRGLALPTRDELDIRLQYVLLASLVGAALGSAGVVYQAILRNPLADPYLLGVSSGASLAAYLWRLPAFAAAGALAAASQQAVAMAGAIVSVSIVFALSTRRGRLEPVTLLLVGVIVNAINGSIFLMVNALKPELVAQGGGTIGFLVGQIQTNLEPHQIRSAAAFIAVAMLLLLALSPQLNVAALSDAEAQALGVRIAKLRWIALSAASLMTAAPVAISGPIGFVGLICPHLARLIVGHDARQLLPWSCAMGAALLALADATSRGLIAAIGTWPPVGVLTGLLGGPFFLWLLWKKRHGAEGGGES